MAGVAPLHRSLESLAATLWEVTTSRRAQGLRGHGDRQSRHGSPLASGASRFSRPGRFHGRGLGNRGRRRSRGKHGCKTVAKSLGLLRENRAGSFPVLQDRNECEHRDRPGEIKQRRLHSPRRRGRGGRTRRLRVAKTSGGRLIVRHGETNGGDERTPGERNRPLGSSR